MGYDIARDEESARFKLLRLEQRSPEWLEWRARGLGASDAPVVLGVSPWSTRLKLWRQKVKAVHDGVLPRDRDSGAKARGRRLEPVALAEYKEFYGVDDLEPVCAEHAELNWLRASLDGWSPTHGLVAEIKCVNADDHRTALAGQIPEKYVPQCQHQLIVTGASFLHYVSFSDYFARGERLAVVPLAPHPPSLVRVLADLEAFWGHVLDKTPPPELPLSPYAS